MSKTIRPLNDFLRVLIAPAIWFAHLVVIYGAEALICISPPVTDRKAMAWTVAIATGAALVGLIVSAAGLAGPWLLVASKATRAELQFLPMMAMALTLLSMLGVVWTAMPATMLVACASPSG